MFRLQNNTPSYYVNNSRDFQLFCRLYDYINNGVKFDIDSIININDPLKINDRLLNLYGSKVGFFTNKNINTNVLRRILKAFPYLIKYKGTKKGIEQAVNTILKLEDTSNKAYISIDLTNYICYIYVASEIKNKDALEELLKYILPIGFIYSIELTKQIDLPTDIVCSSDKVTILINPAVTTSQVRGTDRNTGSPFNLNDHKEQDAYVGSYLMSEVIGSDNYLTTNVTVDEQGKKTYQTAYENDTVGIDGNSTTKVSRDTVDLPTNPKIETITEPEDENNG